jgi:hypothetical protein
VLYDAEFGEVIAAVLSRPAGDEDPVAHTPLTQDMLEHPAFKELA